MAMTPEEYAAKELNVPGWDEDAPIYAPGTEESPIDPNIARVLAAGRGAAPPPAAAPVIDADIAAMAHEYNFVLPLDLRRLELATEVKKQEHFDARTRFWDSLTAAIAAITGLIK